LQNPAANATAAPAAAAAADDDDAADDEDDDANDATAAAARSRRAGLVSPVGMRGDLSAVTRIVIAKLRVREGWI
jgi:hypothetical protein